MTGSQTRITYRHGDLRRALVEAGIALARSGGPEAVVLREATRQAGVVPNAAYRHFASRTALLQAVRASALAALAFAMEAELALVPPDLDAPGAARAGLRAIGTAYVRFALQETGLFRTAFGVPEEAVPKGAVPKGAVPKGAVPKGAVPKGAVPKGAVPQEAVAASDAKIKAGASGLNPFQLLGAALDHMVIAGILPAERRQGAEYLAWSAVHGLAMLVIEGPLHRMDRTQVAAICRRVVDMVEHGL